MITMWESSSARRRTLAAMATMIFALAPVSGGAAATDTKVPEPKAIDAGVLEVAADGSTVKLGIAGHETVAVVVNRPADRALVRVAEAGDVLSATFDDDAKPTKIATIVSMTHPIASWLACAWLLAGGLIVLAFAAMATGGHPSRLVIGADDRYSNSKFQMVLWFGTLFTTYLATVMARSNVGGLAYLGGIGIPQNLLMLSGMSAVTYGAAKAITVQKIDNALGSGNAVKIAGARLKDAVSPGTGAKASRARLTDLVQSDSGDVDLGDAQALFITLLAVVLYLLRAIEFVGQVALCPSVVLPEVDTTLLSVFGLGQGAYLVKKGVSDVGKG